jgi:hypothetical protein
MSTTHACVVNHTCGITDLCLYIGQLDIQASDIIDTKRARKQRIVMVDGKGGEITVLVNAL